MTWDWHEWVLKKHSVTCDRRNQEVGRISNNRSRMDDTSGCSRIVLAFDPETMIRRVMGIERNVCKCFYLLTEIII